MEKNSVLYQLMDIRMDGMIDKIAMADEEYRKITRRADGQPVQFLSCH